MNEDAHPAGFYEKRPDVTWDLAEERWLGTPAAQDRTISAQAARRGPAFRSDVLHAYCRSCDDWGKYEQVPSKHRHDAMIRLGCQHWYECPVRPVINWERFIKVAMRFRWVVAEMEHFARTTVDYRIYHRGLPGSSESSPFVQLNRSPAPRRAFLSPWAEAYARELNPRGRAIYWKLIVRGFTAARALTFAKMAQKSGPG